MADTLAAALDATLGAIKLEHVTAGPAPAGGPDTLSKALDGDRIRVDISGLPGSSAPTALTWNALALLNLWVNYDTANYANPQYAKDSEGVVHLRGVIKDGTATAGTVLATLPVGYRPTKRHVFAIVASEAIEVVDILTNGNIVLSTAAGATFLSLCGLTFSVD